LSGKGLNKTLSFFIKPLFGLKIRLPDSYKGILDYTGPIKEFPEGKVGLVMELEKIIPIDYDNIHKLIAEFWSYRDDRRKGIFKRIQSAVSEIAPKGCYFGRLNGAWGFWEN
jgi:uncharacterized protein (DUF3820 family)